MSDDLYEPIVPDEDDEDITDDITEDEANIDLSDLDISKHDCVFTVERKSTGAHRTFKIETGKNGIRYISIKQKRQWKMFGVMGSGARNNVAYTKRVLRNPPGQKRSKWDALMDLINNPRHYAANGFTYFVSVRCRRCGMSLVSPESIKQGIGPVCCGKED